ncbi:MAG: PAS domain S-box protein [Opitutales bacterium]
MIPPSNCKCAEVKDDPESLRTVIRELEANVRRLEHQNCALQEETGKLRLARDHLGNGAALLRIAGKVARLGGWTIEMPDRKLTWSDETCIIHDAPPGYQPTLKEGMDFFPPEHRAEVERHVETCIQEGIPYEFEVPKNTFSGRRIWVRSIGQAVRDAEGNIIGMQGAFQDITEQRAAAEASRENARRFHEMAENIGEVFFSYDPVNNRLIYANAAFEKIWGRSIEEVYANPPSYLDAVHPDQKSAAKSAFERQLAGEETNVEFRVVRPDGSFRWVHEHAVPVLDSKGRVERIVGTMRDITDRKSFEQQFLRAQRMESIGTLAGGIAHDLNNALAPILMSVGLLKLDETDSERLKLLTHIENSAKHGAGLVKQVLSFARGVEGNPVQVNLRDLVGEVYEIIRDTFPKNIELRTTTSADLWSVNADVTQLNQVLVNLCVNARDSMPEGGHLTIKMRNVVLDKALVPLNPGARPGNHVSIEVEDTGSGIPDEIRERIFDPFFTTKEQGKGTGLGLTTVMSIVKSHNGFVDVQSELGRGTRFTVLLPGEPRNPENPAAAPESAGKRSPAAEGNIEMLLVVDDEESIRFTAKAALEHFGYRVLSAKNGREAVALYERHGSEIAAVVTDMAMPVMDGPATMRALRKINPQVKLIASSGHTNHETLVEVIGFAPDRFLGKPYTVESLMKVVEQILHPE